jgi:hypothetical protein
MPARFPIYGPRWSIFIICFQLDLSPLREACTVGRLKSHGESEFHGPAQTERGNACLQITLDIASVRYFADDTIVMARA